jgi:20S proteasome alpha/beta subunit
MYRSREDVVTIAAAFRCEGGVILCADTEVSGGELKESEGKIRLEKFQKSGMLVAVALAGWADLGKMLIADLFSRLRELTSEKATEPIVINLIVAELEKFHRRHVFKHPQFGYPYGPSVTLLLAINYPGSGQVSMLYTNETAVNRFSLYKAIGAGAPFATNIIKPLSYSFLATMMTTKNVMLLATHVLYQVKKYVPTCGGNSSFLMVKNDGFFGQVGEFNLNSPAAYSETFERIIAELFYASADLDLNDTQVCIGLNLTETRIAEIRHQQRKEKERRAELQKTLELPPVQHDPRFMPHWKR